MKLNETTDMWVVVTKDGFILWGTRTGRPELSKTLAEANRFPWEQMKKLGYRCIPVTVTIKEREV